MRALVVDNDQRLRPLLTRVMQGLGFRTVMEAADGAEALEILTKHPVDIIITDLQMPRLDGLGMARCIRESGDLTPIIMISGQTDPQVILTARETGVDQYLSKPIDIDHLGAAIKRIMVRTAAGASKLERGRELTSRRRKRRSA